MPFQIINSKSLFYTLSPSSTSKSTTLLLHGLGSSSCFYSTVTPLLSQHTTCIALDTPGSGLSELGKEKLSIESIARDAIALLDALDVKEKVVVVGHSMSGIVASYLAADFPERVKGVVLLGPVNPSPALAEPFGKRIEVVSSEGLETLANTIPKAATGSKSTLLHHAFIRSLILGTSSEGYISLCNVIAKAQKPDYSKIKVPLLILAGEDDKTAPLASSEAIADGYGTEKGNKKIEVLKGVGHWHCVEAGEEVGRGIVEFLKGL